MLMEIVRRMTAPVEAATLFAYVGSLDDYPDWMPLIHGVEHTDSSDDERPAWMVELRAQVGPFARSKRLRMVRAEFEPGIRAVFERSEDDGRKHSAWVLHAELSDVEADAASTELTMTMRYDGSLWAGPILERVLDDQVRRGSDNLLQLVSPVG
ncbi:MAG: hypothetical protein ACJAR2_001460 [Ilumatobacter sp.]|jgi:hypothetical protein